MNNYIGNLIIIINKKDTKFSSLAGSHKYGYFPEIFMYYVKGNDDGSTSVVWGNNYTFMEL